MPLANGRVASPGLVQAACRKREELRAAEAHYRQLLMQARIRAGVRLESDAAPAANPDA